MSGSVEICQLPRIPRVPSPASKEALRLSSVDQMHIWLSDGKEDDSLLRADCTLQYLHFGGGVSWHGIGWCALLPALSSAASENRAEGMDKKL